MSWNPSKLNYLKQRLKDKNPSQNLPVIHELLIAEHYVSKLDRNSVELDPEIPTARTCKKPDLRITIDNGPVVFEITAVSEGLAEKKIREIFNDVADHILKDLQNSYGIYLTIDCHKLVKDDKGRIDVDRSIEKIIRFIEKFNLVSVFQTVRNINFRNLVRNLPKDRTLYECRHLMRFSGEPFYDKIEEETVKSFAKSVKVQEIDSSPIDSVVSVVEKYPVVQIQSMKFYPSESAFEEEDAFLNHVIRSICHKLEEDQFDPNSPNVLVVEASNWTLFGYASEKDRVISQRHFEPIKEKIVEFLKERRVPYLSGVIIFENIFPSGRFISNPSVDAKFELSCKERKMLFC